MDAHLTAPQIRTRKVAQGSDPLVMVTAYDTPSALIADEAGVDVILVGDTLAMVVLGHEDTLHVTIDAMVHHTAAVARARPKAMILGDMPWLSYHVSTGDAVVNAAALVRSGASAVKLEGGAKRTAMISAIVDAEIPVCGHLGLTPQSVNALGGFKVQGRQAAAVRMLLDDAQAIVEAGVFAIVLEAVPNEVARIITDSVSVPTIGIGAGNHCDGQVLVWHDLLGLQDRLRPKFVRTYANLKRDAVAALRQYSADVRSRTFPNDDESYHVPGELAATFDRDAAIPPATSAFLGSDLPADQ
jgi:3-methyl-2-oxobutanoate hydroxymethyltransferase